MVLGFASLHHTILVWCLLAHWMITGSGKREFGQESTQEVSGVYSPNLKRSGAAEDFAAAWLITKDRFLASKRFLDASTNMAGVSFAVTRAKCRGCHTMLTRDYFDFLVEHLSTTSNQIPFSNKVVFDIFYKRIQRVVVELRELAKIRPESDPRLNQTVATLIYSSITFSRPQATLQSNIREPYFEATFWSVYRYIPNIVIFVATDHDRIAIEDMKLPALEIKQLEVPRDHKNRTVALPRYSLSWLDSCIRRSMDSPENNPLPDLRMVGVGSNTAGAGDATKQKRVAIETNEERGWSWNQFEYVFFSEGDQILHMRNAGMLYDTLEAGQSKLVVVPHRMQTLPLKQSMEDTSYVRRVYENALHLDLPNSTTITLDLGQFTGSCCDSGRYTVTECGHWWYQCPEWGLRDINPWFQFGKDGFTTPPATAHKGSCAYTPERVTCPLPLECRHRLVPNKGEETEFTGYGVCDEMSIRTRLGPLVAPPIKKKKNNGAKVGAERGPREPGDREKRADTGTSKGISSGLTSTGAGAGGVEKSPEELLFGSVLP